MQCNEHTYFMTPCEISWFVSPHCQWQAMCIQDQQTHGALIPESFQTWEIQGKETFKIGRKTQLIRLHQLAKYRSSLLSESALCQ